MRILRMTEANKKQVLKDVAAQLDGLVVIPDTLSVKLSTSKKPKSSPKIIFTDEAADKIWELVDACIKKSHGMDWLRKKRIPTPSMIFWYFHRKLLLLQLQQKKKNMLCG